MHTFAQSLKMVLWMTFLTGLVYPLLITAIGYFAMPHKAHGSLIQSDKGTIGSKLIAQKFISDKYFWPRPSAVDYNPLPSGASNLGPTSAALKNLVEERKGKLASKNADKGSNVPADLLYASGSGLDPHISLQAAYFQIERISKSRSIDKNTLKSLIDSRLEKRTLGLFGEPRVNVLLLNIQLDSIGN